MVPGSTLRYGSSFCMGTRRPRALSSRPSDEAVSPLPSEEATPPVTNRWQVVELARATWAPVLFRGLGAASARKFTLTCAGRSAGMTRQDGEGRGQRDHDRQGGYGHAAVVQHRAEAG